MIRLTAPGLSPLVIDDWTIGFGCSALDLGWPQTRAVSTDRPGSDGTVDETQFFGARAVSVQLRLFGDTAWTRRSLLDQLYAFLHPGKRIVMEWQDPTGGDLRSITLRSDQSSGPLVSPSFTDVAVSWIAPSGVITSVATRTADLAPFVAAPGWVPPLVPPLTFPAFVGGPGALVNAGTTSADWVARIYGPCVGPKLRVAATGEFLTFPDLTIATGDYLELDSAARTIRVNSDTGATRYSSLDYATSAWFRLAPGSTLVDFTTVSSSSPCVASLSWHDTFIS